MIFGTREESASWTFCQDEIKQLDEEEYAEQESRAFTMLYNAIKDDVAKEILDNLHGELPFWEKAPLPEYTTSGS